LSASATSCSTGDKEHFFIGRFDDLISGVPFLFLREVADVAGMDKEGRLRRHRLDLVDPSVSVAVGSGVGRQMKADMVVADLHKSQLAFGRLGRSGVADQPSVRGTPPLMLQTTPVPAQAMHFNRPRRFILGHQLSPERRGV
jgi:hypothetical protein